MKDEEIDNLFERARIFVERRSEELINKIAIDGECKWSADILRKELHILSGDTEIGRGKFALIGTLGSGVWKWGWANAALPSLVRDESIFMKRFHELTGLQVFEDEAWECDDEQAWLIACLACLELNGDGVYRMPSSSIEIFSVITEMNKSNLVNS